MLELEGGQKSYWEGQVAFEHLGGLTRQVGTAKQDFCSRNTPHDRGGGGANQILSRSMKHDAFIWGGWGLKLSFGEVGTICFIWGGFNPPGGSDG